MGERYPPELIVEIVARCFRLTPEHLKGRRRDQQTALARHVAMYLIKHHTGRLLKQVGQELGGRGYSVVIYACRKIAREVETSPYLKGKMDDIQRELDAEKAEEKNLARKRLAELTTLFFDCRQNRKVPTCIECGGYEQNFKACLYQAEHDEYWHWLDKHPDIFKEGRAALAELLPERVTGS